jgi:hypothetical protein
MPLHHGGSPYQHLAPRAGHAAAAASDQPEHTCVAGCRSIGGGDTGGGDAVRGGAVGEEHAITATMANHLMAAIVSPSAETRE